MLLASSVIPEQASFYKKAYLSLFFLSTIATNCVNFCYII